MLFLGLLSNVNAQTDPIYNYSYTHPAYLTYEGMGRASDNLGLKVENAVFTAVEGKPNYYQSESFVDYKELMKPGDVWQIIGSEQITYMYWTKEYSTETTNLGNIIAEYAVFYSEINLINTNKIILIKSANKNLLSSETEVLSSLSNLTQQYNVSEEVQTFNTPSYNLRCLDKDYSEETKCIIDNLNQHLRIFIDEFSINYLNNREPSPNYIGYSPFFNWRWTNNSTQTHIVFDYAVCASQDDPNLRPFPSIPIKESECTWFQGDPFGFPEVNLWYMSYDFSSSTFTIHTRNVNRLRYNFDRNEVSFTLSPNELMALENVTDYSRGEGYNTEDGTCFMSSISFTLQFSNAIHEPIYSWLPNSGIRDLIEKIKYPKSEIVSYTLKNKDILSQQASTMKNIEALNFESSGLNTTEITNLNNTSGYTNGRWGIWRQNSSYFYEDDRTVNENDQLKFSGEIEDHTFFNEKSILLGNTNKWKKGTEITKYSPNNFALEEKDVLGNYSSVHTSFDDMLVSASVANSKYQESFFESFEAIKEGNDIKSTSNINLSTSKTQYEYVPEYITIKASSKNLVVTDKIFLPEELTTEESKTFHIEGQSYENVNERVLGEFTISNTLTSTDANDGTPITILEFERDNFPDVDLWHGFMYRTENKDVFKDFSSISISQDKAHTGIQSLKVGNDQAQVFSQYKLQLEANKKYHFSGWVSINGGAAQKLPSFTLNTSYSGHRITQAPAITFQLITSSGTVNESCVLKGHPIEGWQLIEGTFTTPSDLEEVRLSLTGAGISTPSGVVTGAYFDDLRFHPDRASMQSYVYDRVDYKLRATLDQNNYATRYAYDEEGKLYLTKKETAKGIKTLQYSLNHTVENE